MPFNVQDRALAEIGYRFKGDKKGKHLDW